MKTKIAVLVTLVIIAICGFKIGDNQARVELLQKTEKCANETVKAQYIGDFYKHQGSTNPNSYYAHTEAFTEMIWAKCFRKELYK